MKVTWLKKNCILNWLVIFSLWMKRRTISCFNKKNSSWEIKTQINSEKEKLIQIFMLLMKKEVIKIFIKIWFLNLILIRERNLNQMKINCWMIWMMTFKLINFLIMKELKEFFRDDFKDAWKKYERNENKELFLLNLK